MAQSTPRTAFFRRYFDNGVQSSLDGIRQDLNTGLAAAVQRLTDLKSDVSVVKQDLGSVRLDVKTVDDRVAGIGGNVSTVPQLLNEVRSKVTDLGDAVAAVNDDVATTTGLVGKLDQDIGAVKQDVGAVNEKVAVTATAVAGVGQQTQSLVDSVKNVDDNVLLVNENVLKGLPKGEFTEEWLNHTFEGLEFDDDQVGAIRVAQQLKKELRGELPPDLVKAKPSDPRFHVLKSKVPDADFNATLDSKVALPQRLALCAKMQAYALGRPSKKGT